MKKMLKNTNLLNFDNQKEDKNPNVNRLQRKIHEIIFEANTFAGKAFDIILLVMILLSVLVLMLDTIPSLHELYHDEFYIFE